MTPPERSPRSGAGAGDWRRGHGHSRVVERTRGWRAAFGFLLASAMAIGSFGAFAVGALAPFIVQDFGISRASVGLLVTVLFAIGSLGSFSAGTWADRLGGRRMLAAVFWLSAIALAGMSLAPTYGWMLAAVAIAGIATAMMNPSTNKLISLHVPQGSRGVIMGVKQSGVQGAGFLSGLILPTTAVLVGWRGAMLVSAVLAAAGALAVWLVVPASEARPSVRGSRSLKAKLGPVVVWLTVCAFLMGSSAAAVSSFLVIYGVESLALTATTAGFAAALLGGVGMVARVVWARRSERMMSASAPLAPLALLGLLAMLLVAGASVWGTWLLWPGVFLFGATATAWNAVGNLVIVRELPAEVAGRSSGTMQVGFYGGFVVSPLLFGWLVDVTESYLAGWGLVAGCCLAATVTALLWERQKRRLGEPVVEEQLGGGWTGDLSL